MVLSLTYFGQTTVPVEVEGLTPDWAAAKGLSEIERFEVFHGNRRVPLAELFRVSGDAADEHLIFEGELSGVHWIGAHQSRGRTEIHGNAGRHVGSQMSGGTITVNGNTSGWTGAEMKNGAIHVHGNAGHLTGAAYRGSSRGMTGGLILVDGSAGNEVGLTMRRGLIAVGGAVGDLTGFNMIAGTIAVFGESGIRPGAGMRRGTIALLGSQPVTLLPTFRFATSAPAVSMRLMLKTLQRSGFTVHPSLFDEDYSLYRGDFVSLGRGEILLRSGVLPA